MTLKEVFQHIEQWAPKEISWQRDNTGLQVGSEKRKLKNIMLCLDATEKVISESIKKNCNLIISHHPLLFNPVKKLDFNSDKNSALVEMLIKNNITLYSAHTNLDYTNEGVSFQLARVLKLKNISFLVNLKSNQFKFVVFVPLDYVEKVSDAIFNAGGGIIGGYTNCSFRSNGKGTFKGSANTNPFIGKKESDEQVDEIRLEVLVDGWKLNKIIQAVKNVHPYEQASYDIYPLENYNVNFGIGAVGELRTGNGMGLNEFLKYVSSELQIKNFRYSKGKARRVKKVALCGGAGFEYLNDALRAGADAFITSDVKYHNFQEAEGALLLIDAGHYETEIHSLNEIKKRIENLTVKNRTKVFKFSGPANPVKFYNN